MADVAHTEEKGLIDELREEIIDGKAVMMAPAKLNHIRVSRNIARFFGNYLEGKTCEVFGDGALLYLSKENQFIPDAMVVCDPSKLKDDGVYGPPDLVVEVLSPSTAKNDRGKKKEIYEKHGIKEYWIISVLERSVEVYLLEDGMLKLSNVLFTPESVRLIRNRDEQPATEFWCSLFPDLLIPMDTIFAGVTK